MCVFVFWCTENIPTHSHHCRCYFFIVVVIKSNNFENGKHTHIHTDIAENLRIHTNCIQNIHLLLVLFNISNTYSVLTVYFKKRRENHLEQIKILYTRVETNSSSIISFLFVKMTHLNSLTLSGLHVNTNAITFQTTPHQIALLFNLWFEREGQLKRQTMNFYRKQYKKLTHKIYTNTEKS